MSDVETTPVVAVVESGNATMSLMDAVRGVLMTALRADTLSRGLNESVKAIDRGDAVLCLLAEDCDESNLRTLVEALCAANNVPVLSVPSRTDLGTWCGLVHVKADEDVEPKIVKTSVAVVRDFGSETEALRVIQAAI